MTLIRSSFVLLVFSLYTHFSTVFAAELVVAIATDRPPYSFRENGIDVGIEVDLVRTIMSANGHSVRFINLPKVRMLKALNDKVIDIATTVTPSNEVNLFFSDTYLEFQNMVISKASRGIQIKDIGQLKLYSFVIWQTGWKSLGTQFEADNTPDVHGLFPKNYIEAPNQLSQSKMFWADRVQLIIVDKTIFEYHKKILGAQFDTSIPLTYHDLIKTKTSYSVAFSQAQLRDQFNEGLKKIRANGDYQKIVNAYL
ncbi:MAG: transporter substrate-binding domain-containing protein [Undibacterium sp.]|nr:transporter substrate-binding domain-containing protein [Undibacterium sp.]